MKRHLLLALTTTLALTACGGPGTPGNTTPTEPTTPTPPTNPQPGDPIWGALQPSTITASQLRACPLADTLEEGIVAPAVLACTKGTFNGITAPGSTKQCSLTLDGNGTMTFTHPDLTQSIVVKKLTNVYYQHSVNNGDHTVALTFEDNRYAKTGWVSIDFAYREPGLNGMPTVYMGVRVDTQTAACYSRI